MDNQMLADQITNLDYRELCEKLSKQVIELEEKNCKLIERKAAIEGLNSRHLSNVIEFENELKDAVLNEEISNDLAEQFAEIFGFDLLQHVDLEITVTFRGTAVLPLTQVVDDIDWGSELNFSCDSHWSEIEFEVEDVSDATVEVI